jgi:transposase
MSKHNRQLKLALADKAMRVGSRALSSQSGVSDRQIRYWASVYKIHGEHSFLNNEKPYSFEFKCKVIKTMLENDWSISYTSAFFDLSSPGSLSIWHKRYSSGGVNTLKPKSKGRQPMKKTPRSKEPKSPQAMTEKELRDELEYLRAENAVLKKLEALAQEKESQTKKKQP